MSLHTKEYLDLHFTFSRLLFSIAVSKYFLIKFQCVFLFNLFRGLHRLTSLKVTFSYLSFYFVDGGNRILYLKKQLKRRRNRKKVNKEFRIAGG